MRGDKTIAERVREAKASSNGRAARRGVPQEEYPEDQRGDAWEPPPPEEPEGGAGYRLAPLDSKAFFSADYRLEWLVQRVLVAGQPAVLGGPKKSLKTSILVDLAVSLASATPFLSRFDVYKPHRVVLLSGESGEAVLQECGRRVCRARGIDPAELNVWWSFRLPQVGNALDRKRLCDGLRKLQANVVLLDPLYLCLLSGIEARDVEAGNLYKMGPLLSDLSRCCLDSGATPILAHHSRKGMGQNHEPLDLDDLSFAGIAEFARQWLLINRRELFDPNTGQSKLWLSVGGSAGQSGCWAVDVSEGLVADDFSGRTWDVAVHSSTEHRSFQEDLADQKKRQREAERERRDEEKFLEALDQLEGGGTGVGLTSLRTAAGLTGDKANAALWRLSRAGIVERIAELPVTIGSGATRKVVGVRRVKDPE